MQFETAFARLRSGRCLARAAWGGAKHLYLTLIEETGAPRIKVVRIADSAGVLTTTLEEDWNPIQDDLWASDWEELAVVGLPETDPEASAASE